MTGADIVAQARKALGVPFRHQGRSPRQGLDCVGLVLWSFHELGLTTFDHVHYAPLPADTASMDAALAAHLTPVPLQQVSPGDVLRFEVAGLQLHLGLATEHGVIHAAQVYGAVVEHRMDSKWQRRLIQAWRVPGMEQE
jgi:lipoprotein Spr